jgi:hypothetical protein
MTEEFPEDEINSAARSVVGESYDPDNPFDMRNTLGTTKEYLDRAEAEGIQLDELLKEDWSRLEVETAAGRIVFKRLQDSNLPAWVVEVVSSEDPSMSAGDIITLDGMTTSGGMTRIGVIGPRATLAFQKRIRKEYKLGDRNDDKELTVTQDRIDEYAQEDSTIFQVTPEGMAVVFTDASPRGTDFVSHALIVREVDGEEASKYIF